MNGNLEICQTIINHLDNSNFGEEYPAEPLLMAATNGHLEICNLLIQKTKEKNPTAISVGGTTTLHFAAQNGHLNVCKLIIER